MRLVLIKIRNLQMATMFGIAVVIINLLAISYQGNDEIENADMTMLAGHHLVIDPGHGGIDSGANSNNVMEKEITFAISAKLANILEEYGAVVTFTRESDIDYYTRGKGGKRNDLLKRIEIFEKSGAELFISVHCNAYPAPNLSGAQVFYSKKFPQSKVLAERLQQALKAFPAGNKRQAKEDSRILVINKASLPGVLIETGYLTNPHEAALLANDSYQQKMVEHIARALAYHFSQDVAK